MTRGRGKGRGKVMAIARIRGKAKVRARARVRATSRLMHLATGCGELGGTDACEPYVYETLCIRLILALTATPSSRSDSGALRRGVGPGVSEELGLESKN